MAVESKVQIIQITEKNVRDAILDGVENDETQNMIAAKFDKKKTWLNYWFTKLDLNWKDLKKKKKQQSSKVQKPKVQKFKKSTSKRKQKMQMKKKKKDPKSKEQIKLEEILGDDKFAIEEMLSDMDESIKDRLKETFKQELLNEERNELIRKMKERIDELNPPGMIKELLLTSITTYEMRPSPSWHNAIFRTFMDIERGNLRDAGLQSDGSFKFHYTMKPSEYQIWRYLNLDFKALVDEIWQQFKFQNAEAINTVKKDLVNIS